MKDVVPAGPLGHTPLHTLVYVATLLTAVGALSWLAWLRTDGGFAFTGGALLACATGFGLLTNRAYHSIKWRLVQVGACLAVLVVVSVAAEHVLAGHIAYPVVVRVGAAILSGAVTTLLGRAFLLAPTSALPAVKVGQIWWAAVPFEGRTGYKDRPVLVVHVGRTRVRVHTFTSVNKTGRAGYTAVGAGVPGSSKASWLRTGNTASLRTEWLRAYGGNAGHGVRRAAGL